MAKKKVKEGKIILEGDVGTDLKRLRLETKIQKQRIELEKKRFSAGFTRRARFLRPSQRFLKLRERQRKFGRQFKIRKPLRIPQERIAPIPPRSKIPFGFDDAFVTPALEREISGRSQFRKSIQQEIEDATNIFP